MNDWLENIRRRWVGNKTYRGPFLRLVGPGDAFHRAEVDVQAILKRDVGKLLGEVERLGSELDWYRAAYLALHHRPWWRFWQR